MHNEGEAVVHGQPFDINSIMMYSKYVHHVLFKGNIKKINKIINKYISGNQKSSCGFAEIGN